jgi:hypothetical protein
MVEEILVFLMKLPMKVKRPNIWRKIECKYEGHRIQKNLEKDTLHIQIMSLSKASYMEQLGEGGRGIVSY